MKFDNCPSINRSTVDRQAAFPVARHNPLLVSFASMHGKVAVFGGSFDPVHRMHVEAARDIRERAGLDAVVFIPAKQNPLKEWEPRASDADRLEMLRLALQQEPGLYVYPGELAREGRSYTVDTLRALTAETPEDLQLHIILGGDAIRMLPQWKEAEAIFDYAAPLIIGARDLSTSDFDGLVGKLPPNLVERLRSGVFEFDDRGISSTRVRSLIKQGVIPEGDLDPAVAEYIRSRGIYREEPPVSEAQINPA